MKLRHTLSLAALAATLAVLASLVSATAARPTAPGATAEPSAAAKKRCRYVVKKVRGKKRRVRVCRTIRPAPRPPAPPAAPSPVLARIDVGAVAWIVTAAEDGSVWSNGEGGVVRIDPATNRISLRTRIEGDPSAGAGSIWVTAGRTLTRLDPRTGTVQATIALPYEAAAVAFTAAGSVWVPTGVESPEAWYLTRVDPASNRVVTTVPMCDVHGKGVTFAGRSLWIACNEAGQVLRLNPATLAVEARVQVASGVHSLAEGAGSVWASNRQTGDLTRIDVATNRVVARVPTSNAVAVVFALDAVWATGYDAVLKIDPATNRIVGRLPVGSGDFYSLAYASGSLWLSTIRQQRVLRLDPVRLRPA